MRSEDQAGSLQPSRQGDGTRLPGVWPAAVIAALAALMAGYLGRPGASAPRPEGAPRISRVAEVAPSDLPAALDTVSGTPQQMAKGDSCGRRLAWVTLVRAPGQPPGQIRLQSGTYVSPGFELLDTPIRVAIPFPDAYPVGHGTISVLGTTTDAIVALAPAWHVVAQSGMQSRDVSWIPVAACQPAGN